MAGDIQGAHDDFAFAETARPLPLPRRETRFKQGLAAPIHGNGVNGVGFIATGLLEQIPPAAAIIQAG